MGPGMFENTEQAVHSVICVTKSYSHLIQLGTHLFCITWKKC